MNPEVDNYLEVGCGRCPLGSTPDCKVHFWPDELKKLREIALECGLNEELKWSVPCYTFESKNLAMVSAFKNYAALSFFKGALLKDTKGLLVAPGANSQSSRLVKFKSIQEIDKNVEYLKELIFQAIRVEKDGLKVEFKKDPEPIPNELKQKLEDDLLFKTAFEALTPGRQRGYVIYFSQPKQSKTRIARIEKYEPMILNGEGIHDHYKSRKK